MSVIVDSNIIIDIITKDKIWYGWSSNQLKQLVETDILVINQIIYSEVSIGFDNIEDLETVLPSGLFLKENLPWEASFLAGKCFLDYRRNSGTKGSPLPDFYIGAHAAVTKRTLLTRDKRRYKKYFPNLKIISP